MSKEWGAARSWTPAASTPAALSTNRASKSPWFVWTSHEGPASPAWSRSSPVTAVFKCSSAPFFTAVSARARQYSQGEQMAAEGACRAAATSSDRFGSRERATAPSSSFRPGTPLAWPLRYSSSRAGRSSSEKASTREPQGR